jgi:hypothetical protein
VVAAEARQVIRYVDIGGNGERMLVSGGVSGSFSMRISIRGIAIDLNPSASTRSTGVNRRRMS